MIDFRALIMGLSFALIWSSAFVSAKIIVLHASPFFALSLRFAISGLLALAISKAMKERWPDRAQWKTIIVFGICQNAIYLGFNFYAMQWIEASLAAIIASTMPLFVVGLGALFLNERISKMATLGIILGFAGVILIMGQRVSGGAAPFAVIMCVVAAIALSIATLSLRKTANSGNLMMLVAMQMFVGGIVLSLPAIFLENLRFEPVPEFWYSFFYTVLFPGVLATFIWFKLVERIGTAKSSAFHFLNPVFGVGIAALILSEKISPTDIIGVIIVSVGIFMVQVSRIKRA